MPCRAVSTRWRCWTGSAAPGPLSERPSSLPPPRPGPPSAARCAGAGRGALGTAQPGAAAAAEGGGGECLVAGDGLPCAVLGLGD